MRQKDRISSIRLVGQNGAAIYIPAAVMREWKANQHGRTIIRVDPHHTSKRCSRCGYINHNLQLHHRTYKCPNCGYKADRDYNASLNILQKGLEVLQKPLSAGHVEYMREMASGGST